MRAFTSKTVGIFQLPMHSGQNEPQTGVQTGDILRIMDELHAWTDFMCFPSVRCIRTKRSGSGKARSPRGKEYSNKVRLEVELLSSHFLPIFLLRFAEKPLSDVVLRLRFAIRPVNRLPPEILARCFLLFTLTLGPRDPQHTCITLVHVCKRWREVAFGFSGLWNRVGFTRPEVLVCTSCFRGPGGWKYACKPLGVGFARQYRGRGLANSGCSIYWPP